MSLVSNSSISKSIDLNKNLVVLDEFWTQGNLVLKEYPRRVIRRKGTLIF
jgi:hypothetical protein